MIARSLLAAVGLLAGVLSPIVRADHIFNPTDNTVLLDRVLVAGTGDEYTEVRVRLGSFKLISVGPAVRAGAEGAAAFFHAPTRRLSLPRVRVGDGFADNVLVELGSDFAVLGAGGWRRVAASIVPSSSSHDNKVAAGNALGPQWLPNDVQAGNAAAFADFFADGTLSLVTHTLTYTSTQPWDPKRYGEVRFYRSGANPGSWEDRTSELLRATTGCLHPRKAVVADYNGDGRPDVFFACHGYDAAPFPGEAPRILLSLPDGTYRGEALPLTGFFHAASAADINGDGLADILLVNNMEANSSFFLVNNGNGTFTRDDARMPESSRWKGYFTAELIDVDGAGRYSAFLAGHEQADYPAPATLYRNDGTGHFRDAGKVSIPAAPGYGFATDVVFANGTFFLARTIDLPNSFYGGAAIQKVAYPGLAATTLFQRTGSFPLAGNWTWGTSWINWIIPYQGRIHAMDLAYNVSVPQ